jgi:hypothetical protein
MGAALLMFVLLSISVFVIRVASVALRLTGLAEDSARFQALSAFTGTGFTTREAETIVNYPVRRRIISLLMIIGNLGLVTVLATVVVSLVNTAGEIGAVLTQLAWLMGGLVLLWFFMLNAAADRAMCNLIGRFLASMTFLGKRRFQRLLQIGDGYSVCEHPVTHHKLNQGSPLDQFDLKQLGLTVLAVRTSCGTVSPDFSSTAVLRHGDALVLYGRDDGHEALELNSFK